MNIKKHILDEIPLDIAPLEQAYRIQGRAAEVGFDWTNIDDVISKIKEEIGEFKVDSDNNDYEKMTDEMGDILMAVVNLARFTGINPAEALNRTIKKFRVRFAAVEDELYKRGKKAENSTLEEMDAIWNESKKII
ncbi:hypothetical protein KA977_08570 [Candidatus Dependentiae bacterium]|nr:hypothetical protein [Candidatus Dependentiae bacterium]